MMYYVLRYRKNVIDIDKIPLDVLEGRLNNGYYGEKLNFLDELPVINWPEGYILILKAEIVVPKFVVTVE